MELSPDPILQMMQGMQATAIVRAGIDHNVFDAIADGETDAASIAAARDADPRGMVILLDALSALGLLERGGSAYALTPLSDTFLRSDRPTYVGGLAKIFASRNLAAHLDTMTEAVSSGGAVTERHAETPEHPFWIDFAQGSAAMAGPAGTALAALVKPWLSERDGASVLDVACGSGLYGYSVAVACDGARVVSQDWPSVLEHAAEVARSMGLGERVSYLPGDLFQVDLGGPHELVIASHVFHHFDPPTCQRLLARLGEATRPGGKIAVHEFVVGEASPGEDPAPYLFSAMMLTWTRKGQAYGREDYQAWLTEAGFSHLEVHEAAGLPTRFLVATKKR